MGAEINLLIDYPKSKRNLDDRNNYKTDENVKIARKFEKEFFDGTRETGYGGFTYNPKYWTKVVKKFKEYWKINSNNSLLDVGCAKGFMLHDFKKELPNLKICGIDISKYAIENSMDSVKDYLSVCNAKKLPFEDNSFDYVISINTVHNLELEECEIAIKEIQRVCKKNSFITVDAFKNDEEKERMYKWNLTAKLYYPLMIGRPYLKK